MSRIGQKPIALPDKVKISVNGPLVNIEGPRGKLKHTLPAGIKARLDGKTLLVEKVADQKAKAGKPELLVKLRGQGKTRAITQITRVSKPGRRQYVGAREIPRVLGGMGVSVVSTPRGVMAGHQAKKQNLGGELLLTIY